MIYVIAAIVTVAALSIGVLAAQARTAGSAPAAAEPGPGAASTADPAAHGSAGTSGLPGASRPEVEAHGHDEHPGAASRDYTPGAPAPAAPAALQTVLSFAQAWANPGLDAEAWWGAISPLCEPGFAGRLKTTDPATIPAAAITGDPQVVSSRTDLVTATVATPGGVLTVTTALLGDRWLVTGNDYARTLG